MSLENPIISQMYYWLQIYHRRREDIWIRICHTKDTPFVVTQTHFDWFGLVL